jgi:hypothetical protein
MESRGERKAGDLAMHLFSPSGTCQHRTRFGQESPAGVREHDAAADTVKQFDAVTFLKCGDGRAGSRLGQVQLAGGLGDMLFLGNRYKDPELLKRHDLIIP